MSYICGVDPGLSGAICLLAEGGSVTFVKNNEPTLGPIIFFDMPIHEITVNGKKKRRLDLYALGKFFDEHSKNISRAIVEDVTASPQMGVTSSFSFGFSAGAIQGIIAANFISMARVSPRTWKKAMGLTADKDACRRQASEMYPGFCHLWGRAKDDGRAESLLLAHYGLQKGHE